MGKVKKVVRAKETNATRKAASSAAPARPASVPDANQATLDRRDGDRRRSDRRQQAIPVAVERRKGPRRKVQRRRQIDPTTCERDYSIEELEFMSAMDAYKRSSGRMFPTCSEVLEVLRGLGYEKRLVVTESAPTPPAETAVAVDAAAAGAEPPKPMSC